jgi:hypothetical protein
MKDLKIERRVSKGNWACQAIATDEAVLDLSCMSSGNLDPVSQERSTA